MDHPLHLQSESEQVAPRQLLQLQQQFKDYVLHAQQKIAGHIVSTREFGNEERLAIYGNGYYLRLIEVLEKDYSALHTLLGDDQFEELAVAYIRQHPSTYTSVRDFGNHMARFVSGHGVYKQYEYLRELAEFEWAFADAFDAPDVGIVNEGDAALVPPEAWPDLSLRFHPSLQLISYTWNILPVWRALKEQSENDEDAHSTAPELKRLSKRETCLIWRCELTTQYRTLEADEARLLPAAMEGATFSGLCEMLAENMDDAQQVPLRAASLLKSWLAAGLIAELCY